MSRSSQFHQLLITEPEDPNQSEDIDDLEECAIEVQASPIQKYFPVVKTKSQLLGSIQTHTQSSPVRPSSWLDTIKHSINMFTSFDSKHISTSVSTKNLNL